MIRPIFAFIIAAAACGCATLPPHLSDRGKDAERRAFRMLRNLPEENRMSLSERGGLLLLNPGGSPIILPGDSPLHALDASAAQLPAGVDSYACFYVTEASKGIRPQFLDCAQLAAEAQARKALRDEVDTTRAELRKLSEAATATAAIVSIHNLEIREIDKGLTSIAKSFESFAALLDAQNGAMSQFAKSFEQNMQSLQQLLQQLKQRLDQIK